MKTKFKKLSDTRVEITVTLDAKDWKAAAKEAEKELAKEIKVEGFRKGKVPVEVARKFIPENDLNSRALDHAVRSTVIAAFKEHEQSPLVVPSVNVTKYVPGEMIEYTAVADIVPEIKLGDYKKLGVKKETVKVTEKDITDVLKNLANSFAEKKTVKRAAKLSDEVIIDFVGKKGGEPFQGGSAKDYHLTLGSNTFIPGFEDGVVGHEPGDKFELKLTFPKEYGIAELAGAKTTFDVLLKQVNEIKAPEINDELAKKCGPFETLKDLKEDIKKNISAQNDYRLEEKFKNDLVDALVKKSKVSAPEIMVDNYLKMIRDDVNRNAESSKLSFEEYVKRAGTTLEEWEKEARKVAEQRAKMTLVLQTLATKEDITVSEEVVDAKLAELRDVYKKSPEALKSLKDPNVKNNVRNQLIIEETVNFLAKKNS